VCALIAAGANVDVADNIGATPLYVAAHKGHVDAMRALLAAGANVDAVADGG
jgi:ankyrin repeat protein